MQIEWSAAQAGVRGLLPHPIRAQLFLFDPVREKEQSNHLLHMASARLDS